MPIWSQVLRELLAEGQPDGFRNYDGVRRKYLHKIHCHTEANVILYASGWLQQMQAPGGLTSINDEDIQAFMEVCHGMRGGRLDLILYSPGGSPEAAEAIVSYLRQRFSAIRVIVPHLAMSAATMIACAANEVVLGEHSFLGPTDPQIFLPTPLGTRIVPAQAVLDQFDMAKREYDNPATSAAFPIWLPMLAQYGPDLLVLCESAMALSKELVKLWLEAYMFKGKSNCSEKAERIAEWLADHNNFKSHSRHIARDKVEEQGLSVFRLEEDRCLQDLVLSAFHATTLTFSDTRAAKIVENHAGRAFIKNLPPIAIPPSAVPIPGNQAWLTA